ncbi:hypothetical protein [Streptomyces ginkgonis]|uniref:hypothetical protein n=1 Tax=Streptomyces ginkgonis TaxID=1812259 RepID=UPI002176E576|nr:hypothetical protein [Streptomyces ginkgonis]
MNEPLECMEGPGPDCSGPVNYRYPFSGVSFPRCDAHWEARVEREEQYVRDYGPYNPFVDDDSFDGDY